MAMAEASIPNVNDQPQQRWSQNMRKYGRNLLAAIGIATFPLQTAQNIVLNSPTKQADYICNQNPVLVRTEPATAGQCEVTQPHNPELDTPREVLGYIFADKFYENEIGQINSESRIQDMKGTYIEVYSSSGEVLFKGSAFDALSNPAMGLKENKQMSIWIRGVNNQQPIRKNDLNNAINDGYSCTQTGPEKNNVTTIINRSQKVDNVLLIVQRYKGRPLVQGTITAWGGSAYATNTPSSMEANGYVCTITYPDSSDWLKRVDTMIADLQNKGYICARVPDGKGNVLAVIDAGKISLPFYGSLRILPGKDDPLDITKPTHGVDFMPPATSIGLSRYIRENNIGSISNGGAVCVHTNAFFGVSGDNRRISPQDIEAFTTRPDASPAYRRYQEAKFEYEEVRRRRA